MASAKGTCICAGWRHGDEHCAIRISAWRPSLAVRGESGLGGLQRCPGDRGVAVSPASHGPHSQHITPPCAGAGRFGAIWKEPSGPALSKGTNTWHTAEGPGSRGAHWGVPACRAFVPSLHFGVCAPQQAAKSAVLLSSASVVTPGKVAENTVRGCAVVISWLLSCTKCRL